jgi:carbonic anhydrase
VNSLRLMPRLDLGLRARVRAWRSGPGPGGVASEARAGLTALGLSLPLAVLLAPQTGVAAPWLVLSSIAGSALVALFGGSPFALAGPGVATASAVAVLSARHGPGGLALACAACGLLQVATGTLGLGRYVRLVPLPVVAAFVSALGGWVLLMALPHALGLPAVADPSALPVLDHLLAGLSTARLPALIIAVLAAAATLAGRRWLPRAPVGLAVLAAAGGAVTLAHLSVPLLPDLSLSLSTLAFPALPSTGPVQFAGAVLVLWVLASSETLLSAVAERETAAGTPRADPDQDLIGHGLANVAVAFLGGVPSTGAAIRGEALRTAGGRGATAAFLHAVLAIPLLLLFLATERFLPVAALAGVVIAHALPLMSLGPWRAILRASRGQAAILAITFAAMVGVGLITGVELGVGLSLFAALLRVGRTRVTVHRGAAGAPQQITFSGPLTFLASSRLDFLDTEIETLDLNGGVILDLRHVPSMDFTGARRLASSVAVIVDHGGRVALLGVPPSSRALLLGADPRGLVGQRMAVTEADVDQILERPQSFELRAQVVASVGRFRDEVREHYEPLFEKLAEDQRPHTLFIGCVDSRVTPAALTGTHPGELFVVRCLGAIVVPPGGTLLGGEAAAVEYAVGVLGVRNIVVCGHSRCGAIRAVSSGQVPEGLTSLARWLRAAVPAAGDVSGAVDLDQAARDATVRQLDNLMGFPHVRAAVEANTLQLHAWFYDVGRAELYEWRPEQRAFVVLRADVEPFTPPAGETATSPRSA